MKPFEFIRRKTETRVRGVRFPGSPAHLIDGIGRSGNPEEEESMEFTLSAAGVRSPGVMPPNARNEAGGEPAQNRSTPGHAKIRVKIDPDKWRAIAPPATRHDSAAHRPSAIGKRSEIHSGKWEGPFEGLHPFGGKEPQ
jgi:hypothetical protein